MVLTHLKYKYSCYSHFKMSKVASIIMYPFIFHVWIYLKPKPYEIEYDHEEWVDSNLRF